MDTIDYIIVMLIIILLVYLMYMKCDFSLDINEHLLIISIGLVIFGIIILVIDEKTVNKEFLENEINQPDNNTDIDVEINTENGNVIINKPNIKSFNEDNIVEQQTEYKYEVIEIPSEEEVMKTLKCEEGPRKNKDYGYSYMPPCEWGYVVEKIENEKACNICSKMNSYASDHLVLENGFYGNTTLPPKNN
jgi:hypothetical protein